MDYEPLLLGAKTIAIVGCAPDPEKPSHQVAEYLQKSGYEIVPIYPKEERILGEKVYRSLSEIDRAVDIVVAFRKADFAGDLLDEVLRLAARPKIFWLQEGIKNSAVCERAAQNGLIAVEDLCIMKAHKRAQNGEN